jgi:hypothetical protein
MGTLTLDDLLERYQLDVSADEVLADFSAALSAVPRGAALPDAEVTFLAEHGGPDAAAAVAEWEPERERQERAKLALRGVETLLAESLSVKQAAEAIGVDRSVMQRHVSSGRVYSFQLAGRRHRIPRWQIAAGRLLPGCDKVASSIPDALSPLTVAAFMHAVQPELAGQTPVAFLAEGGKPEAVADLVAGLDVL